MAQPSNAREAVRILQITSANLLNGAARYAAATSRILAERGHEVILLTRPSLDLSTVQAMPREVRLRNSSLRRIASEIRRIGELCRAEGIDVVHTHMSSAHAFGALLRIFYGVPCVATAHKLNLQLHWVINDRVICHNDESMRYMRLVNLVPLRRLRKVPAWIDGKYLAAPTVERTAVRSRLGIPQDKVVLATVGNIEPRKGLMDLVDALPALAAAHDVCCLFCGRDIAGYRSHVDKRARELGVAGRVIWPGQLPDSDMAQLLAACDLYVQPSRVETGPLIVLEAMALGAPVIGTMCGSMPEFIVPGVTGDLVPVKDPPRLARAIATALQDRTRLALMGAEGRRRYQAEFSTGAVFSRIEAALEEAAHLGLRRRWRRFASMARPIR